MRPSHSLEEARMLRKVECFLTPSKLDPLRDMLVKHRIEGMSVLQAQGFGTRSKLKNGIPQFEDRVKVEIVVDEHQIDTVMRGIQALAGDGQIGAGKVFVIPVEDAVRLSTREAGRSALK
jgi:nitrogen regulatory protein P-II 1